MQQQKTPEAEHQGVMEAKHAVDSGAQISHMLLSILLLPEAGLAASATKWPKRQEHRALSDTLLNTLYLS